MPSQSDLQQLLNIFICIQQSFVFRITKSVASISYYIDRKTLTLRIYVFETISDSEVNILIEANNEIEKRTTKKSLLEIIRINNKTNLLDLHTLKYKFYLKCIC